MVNWCFVNIWNLVLWIQVIVKKGEEWVMKFIEMENENIDYVDLVMVLGFMNMVCFYVKEGFDFYVVCRYCERVYEFFWMKDEGLFVNGINGVQCWDIVFVIQVVMDVGLIEDFCWWLMLMKVFEFLDD